MNRKAGARQVVLTDGAAQGPLDPEPREFFTHSAGGLAS